MESKKIKSINNKQFSIEFYQDEYNRYCVKYKRNSMPDYTTLSFKDLKLANHIFDQQLIVLEGH